MHECNELSYGECKLWVNAMMLMIGVFQYLHRKKNYQDFFLSYIDVAQHYHIDVHATAVMRSNALITLFILVIIHDVI